MMEQRLSSHILSLLIPFGPNFPKLHRVSGRYEVDGIS